MAVAGTLAPTREARGFRRPHAALQTPTPVCPESESDPGSSQASHQSSRNVLLPSALSPQNARPPMTQFPGARQLEQQWNSDPRWHGVRRSYGGDEVVRLRGRVAVEHSLARLGAEKLWKHLHALPFVNALGALTGNQAVQQVKAGL